MMYCDSFAPSLFDEWQAICQSFVDSVNEFMPELIHKLKIHLVLHIPQCFMQYGPTAAFSAERKHACYTMNCTNTRYMPVFHVCI